MDSILKNMPIISSYSCGVSLIIIMNIYLFVTVRWSSKVERPSLTPRAMPNVDVDQRLTQFVEATVSCITRLVTLVVTSSIQHRVPRSDSFVGSLQFDVYTTESQFHTEYCIVQNADNWPTFRIACYWKGFQYWCLQQSFSFTLNHCTWQTQKICQLLKGI